MPYFFFNFEKKDYTTNMKLSNIKKVFILIVVSFLVLNLNCFNTSVLALQKPNYAQIINSNTYLYSNADNSNLLNKWCLIENSYFVKIVNNYNTDFFKVEYNNITGFVKKSEVNLINETPLVPYPVNINFNIGNSNCYLRSSPKIKGYIDNVLEIIPAGTHNLKFIGKIIGEEGIDFKGSIWYLTEFNGKKGYVYSQYTTSVTPISINNELVTPYSGKDFSKINPLTNLDCVIIIGLTLIPCIVILFLLYIPRQTKAIKAKPNSTKPDIEDYANFFDENL